MSDGPDITEKVLRRLRSMEPPEVRPIGEDPGEWESDLPEADARPGDRYSVSIAAEGVSSVRWVKERSAEEWAEEDSCYSITGNFNSWSSDRMEPGDLPGQSVATVQVPASGVLEFRFLQDEDPDKALCPATPSCTRRSESILGPGPGLENSWLVRAEPRAEVQVELLRVKDRL